MSMRPGPNICQAAPHRIQAGSRTDALHNGAASTAPSFHTSLASSASIPELWLGDSLAAFVEFFFLSFADSFKSPALFPSRFL